MTLVTILGESTALGKFLSLQAASQDSDMGRELPQAQGHNVYERATYFLEFWFGEVALVCSGRSAPDLVIFSSALSLQSLLQSLHTGNQKTSRRDFVGDRCHSAQAHFS